MSGERPPSRRSRVVRRGGVHGANETRGTRVFCFCSFGNNKWYGVRRAPPRNACVYVTCTCAGTLALVDGFAHLSHLNAAHGPLAAFSPLAPRLLSPLKLALRRQSAPSSLQPLSYRTYTSTTLPFIPLPLLQLRQSSAPTSFDISLVSSSLRRLSFRHHFCTTTMPAMQDKYQEVHLRGPVSAFTHLLDRTDV